MTQNPPDAFSLVGRTDATSTGIRTEVQQWETQDQVIKQVQVGSGKGFLELSYRPGTPEGDVKRKYRLTENQFGRRVV